jgi:hypothetical protein
MAGRGLLRARMASGKGRHLQPLPKPLQRQGFPMFFLLIRC